MIKKIETRESKEKKQRIRNTIIGIVIVALMILSTLGYVIMDRGNGGTGNQGNMSYNGFAFKQTQNGWQTTVQGSNIITMYLPQEILDSNGTGNPSTYNFAGKIVYIDVSSEQEAYASYDLLRNLDLIAQRAQFACSQENENSSFCQDKNLPIESCDSLDSSSRLINIKTTNSSATYSSNNGCWTIEGQDSSLIKASDNFIFKLFGVI